MVKRKKSVLSRNAKEFEDLIKTLQNQHYREHKKKLSKTEIQRIIVKKFRQGDLLYGKIFKL